MIRALVLLLVVTTSASAQVPPRRAAAKCGRAIAARAIRSRPPSWIAKPFGCTVIVLPDPFYFERSLWGLEVRVGRPGQSLGVLFDRAAHPSSRARRVSVSRDYWIRVHRRWVHITEREDRS